MKKIKVRVDSRNRICLTKLGIPITSQFFAYEEGGKIILEPLFEVSSEEAWLFSPQNREYLQQVKKNFMKKMQE